MFQTITTLGYGDVTPVGQQGRIVAAIIVMIGLLVTSIFVGSLAVFLSPSPFESGLLITVAQESAMRRMKEDAAMLVMSVLRTGIQIRKGKSALGTVVDSTNAAPTTIADKSVSMVDLAGMFMPKIHNNITPQIYVLIRNYKTSRMYGFLLLLSSINF